MAIAYLPSEGNLDKVHITTDLLWYGESIGGPVVDKIKFNNVAQSKDYYSYIYGNLGSASRWFYKDVTDYNFINGVTVYRCMYIGADDQYNESEILGTISSLVTHNGPVQANNTVNVSLFAEGIYTSFTSKNSMTLNDEEDTTGILASATWATSLSNNTVLNAGQYLKVWIKIEFVQNPSLQIYTNYDYFISIKDLTIPIHRTSGRLSLSKIFTAVLTDTTNEIVFEQSLPQDFQVDNVYKIIEHNNLTNIFYFYQNRFKLLIVKRNKTIEDNKYVNIDITSILPDITAAPNNILDNFSICYSSAISGTDPGAIGTSGTPSTTGTVEEYPVDNIDYDLLLNGNFICDIFGTLKPDLNNFYIFYNKFLTDDSDSFVQQHGTRNYFWSARVLKIDLNFINDTFFDSVNVGISNTKNIVPPDAQDSSVKDKFYINTATQQDDLFTLIGYIPEDCRVINNVSKMIYLFEGDIIRDQINSQEMDIPKVENRSIHTIKNSVSSESYLYYDPTLANEDSVSYKRHMSTLDDAANYVVMGPPTQKAFTHGYSKVSYDAQGSLDQFACSWAFGVNQNSITTTTGTTGTSGVGTSGTSATPPVCYFDDLNPAHHHLKLQSDYDSVVGGIVQAGCLVDPLNLIDEYVEIFRVHCNGNEDQAALYAFYNFYLKKWNITIINEVKEKVTFALTTNPLFTSDINVITVNTFRQLDFGCAKKYIVQYSIHVNGKELINGMTYTHDTSDTYVITHNPNGDFSGYVTYWENRDYIETTEAEKYAEALYRIHSNIAWALLEPEITNNTYSKYSNFAYRRNILLQNFISVSDEYILFPVVLQGTGYNVSSTINNEVRRSVFNFSKIDINNKSFIFTLEGTDVELSWKADTFNIDTDTLTIWVRLDNWTGQRITMYYSDMDLILPTNLNDPFQGFFSVWLMDTLMTITQKRNVDQKVFSSGESFVYTKTNDGVVNLVEITKQVPFGKISIYKSNKFNVQWDDISFDSTNTNNINAFIESEIKKFKPSFMELNEIISKLPYKLEANNNHKHSDGVTDV